MTKRHDFREEIRTQMDRTGISRWVLANRAGLRSPVTLYRYLKGKTEITAGNLEKLLNVLESLPDKGQTEKS